jgi:hypothetical protein
MTLRASYGMANPNSLFDAKTVREIRLQHLCDGIAASQIARDLEVNVSSISRIVNWKSWAQQDEDLRGIPKPVHKGGGDYHRPKGAPVVAARLTCRSCLHLNDNTGVCDFGFPESLTSAYTFAAKCSVYQPVGNG